jgi:uncharacterized protein
MSSDERLPPIPTVLQRLSTDEYRPPPYQAPQKQAIAQVHDRGGDDARRVRRPLADYWSSRRGTAAGLLALNEAFGHRYYSVPEEARYDQEAADASLGGTAPIIDVQTHFIADRPGLDYAAQLLIDNYAGRAPDWWTGLDGVTSYNLAEYLRCVFVESETAVAVLTAPPTDHEGNVWLHNEEMAGVRELIDRMAGSGRLLNHTVVHPAARGTLDQMVGWRDELKPVGWKVYTLGMMGADGRWEPGSQWMLDDERVGLPFLERVRDLGMKRICSHKGLSNDVDNGSPRDIGPSAKAFPDIEFLIYHSAFEPHIEEVPYSDETIEIGTNRLVRTLEENGIPAGGNVYAELGTTWFCLVKRPDEAAHVLGKLLLAVGEDNVLWGTDGIWYGPTQPVIDAFRAFQIPEEMSERYGYPQLTPAIKDKILGRNAARVYGLDLDAVQSVIQHDDVSWARAALAEYRSGGIPWHEIGSGR